MALAAVLRRTGLTSGLVGLLSGAVLASGMLSTRTPGTGQVTGPGVEAATGAATEPGAPLRLIDLTTTGAGRDALDGDHDGWADWVERIEGSDAARAASRPTAVTLEIVGTIVCLRPAAHPGEVAVLDLSLPEGTVPGRDLLATFGSLVGLSPRGVAHTRLATLLRRLAAAGLLTGSGVSAEVGPGARAALRKRVAGMAVPLVGGGDDWDLGARLQRDLAGARTARLTIGLGRDGTSYLAVDNGTTLQWHAGRHRAGGRGLAVHSLLASPVREAGGRTTTYWERLVDGRTVRTGTLTDPGSSPVDPATPTQIDRTFPWA